MAETTQEPLGKVEQMLVDMINGEPIVEAPENRIEGLLMELAEAIEQGGGGGGTTNYNALSNKPKINNIELSGNKTAAQLGLQGELSWDETPTEGSSNPVKSGGIFDELAKKVTAEEGKGLSSNDYTNGDKDIVDGVTTALNGKVDKETGKSLIDLTTVVDGASYDSTNHLILFKNGTTTLFSLDAAAFVKDGMVDTVTITGGNLVITFNTDAGKQAISIPLTDIFDPANYYDKDDVDGFLADKADKVASATNGNFAGLDANGNLTDSGKKASDFATPENVQDSINTSADLLKDTVGWTGKNLLPYPYKDDARTHNGVTYVYNSDNTITANGTATSTSWRTLTEDFSFLELGKKYRLSGCPTGGSSNSYLVQLTYNDGTEKFLKDYGDGIEFTYTGDFIRLQVIVKENYTANNLVFKPMIRRADITDPTYEPYHESVEVMYEEEIHGVNLFDDSKIEVGKAWNGDTNANRARNIIPCEPNSEYIVSMNGTNGLDSVFFSVSENIPPASQTAITSFPYTIRTGISDRYITLGFNKTNIALSDVTSLKIMLCKADIEDSTYRPYNEQAIQNQLNAQGVLGAKNWLPNIVTNQTKNGITWTKNSDGTLAANGTATAASEVAVVSPNTYDTAGLLQSGQKYIYSIGIPLNMLSTYGIEAYGDFRNDTDTGWEDGLPIDTPFSGKPNKVGFYIRVKNGITVNNLVFKPMVRLASDPDDTYQPYTMTNRELTEFAINKMGRQLPLVNLGTEYTAELKADISSGKFEKAVVGGYLTINGHVYYLAHPDYWLHTGDTECTTHHMLVIPAGNIGTGKMNDTNITTGGYAGSDFKTGNNSNTALATARAQIIADFGASNILTHREMFTTAVTDGKASNWAWSDSDIDLMNEVMVYGCSAWASHPGYETGIDKCQLKLFQERPDLITTRAGWWLRSVVSATGFAFVYNNGCANRDNASNAHGVRPVFAIIGG